MFEGSVEFMIAGTTPEKPNKITPTMLDAKL